MRTAAVKGEMNMAQKVQKVRSKLEKKGYSGIECTEVGKCIRLEGEMTEWTDIVKAGKAAAKFGYKGVLNDISLKGFTEPAIRAPKFTDGSLEGAQPDVLIIGGGGKTTLMYNLAAHCARKGWRVLAATTTHIMQPPGGVWAQTDAELFRLWKCGSYAVAGTAAHGGKLTAPPQAQLERWMTLADIVLIEADGAKRMPCKAPAAHEPVLLPQCDTVLAVAGLSALRHPLREVCFRAELAAELLCVPQDAQLTPELLANLLASEAGGRKAVGDRSFYVVLNQVDTKEQAALARQVADILKKIYRISCATSHFEKGERA